MENGQLETQAQLFFQEGLRDISNPAINSYFLESAAFSSLTTPGQDLSLNIQPVKTVFPEKNVDSRFSSRLNGSSR